MVKLRLVVQRVAQASVEVEGRITGQIQAGLLALVGFTAGDSSAAVNWMARRLTGLRIFEDENEKMNLAVSDIGGGILLVPQFTLYGDCQRGRRPSFTAALAPSAATLLFDEFCEAVGRAGVVPQRGVFGAQMRVALLNEGPVTLIVDSPPNLSSPDDQS